MRLLPYIKIYIVEIVMYRPVQPNTHEPSIKNVFFSEKNYNTLQTVLIQDCEQRTGSALNDLQKNRLTKTLDHYIKQVYQKQGEKPLTILNREVLGTCSKDFSQYMQRKEITHNSNSVKNVMDDQLYHDTSHRFERLTTERNEVKALPPSVPDFRISLSEDGPPAAEMFERAKKQRELEALRSAKQVNDMVKAEAGVQGRVLADSNFHALQDSQNRNTELALVAQRYTVQQPMDTTLAILPDRRDLLIGAIGSFDTMTPSKNPRELGQANSNPTTIYPELESTKNNLSQHIIIPEEKIVSYREVENNLFIYSADRDWLRNNKENRYQFTVNFDPAANGQSFGSSIASQQKFKNIVRIELVKAIMPGESLNVTVYRTRANDKTNTTYQDNILNLPYVIVRVAELENNNYGTDNHLDRSFGVLQYDAQWVSDPSNQHSSTRGFLAMIPKFLKCQKEYYPTPLSTLQKMTIDIRRPNGELLSTGSDTFDIGGIIAPQGSGGITIGTVFPFTNAITNNTLRLRNNVMIPSVGGTAANFYINTAKYFNKFEICPGDRIQIAGYSYPDAVLNDPTYGQTLRAFCTWINRPEGHVAIHFAYSTAIISANNQDNMIDGFNDVGYANFIVIPAPYQDPTTGNVQLAPFGSMMPDGSYPNIGAILNAFGVSLQPPTRLINVNRQLNLVFRIITRDMDSLPQLRPDNTF